MTDNEDALRQKSFDVAGDLVKQVITLSSGIIALTITFFNDFAGDGAPQGARNLMAVSWVLYVLAILFGILTLSAMTGTLQGRQDDVNKQNIRLQALVLYTCFVGALLLSTWAGAWALTGNGWPDWLP